MGLEDGKLIVVGAGQPAEVSVDPQPRWWGLRPHSPLGAAWLGTLAGPYSPEQRRWGGMGKGIWNGGGDGERDGRWMTMRKELGRGWGGGWERGRRWEKEWRFGRGRG